jgi:hypothetical protein
MKIGFASFERSLTSNPALTRLPAAHATAAAASSEHNSGANVARDLPEPAVLFLLGLGLACVAARVRSSRRNS